jgi:hypothetical protein
MKTTRFFSSALLLATAHAGPLMAANHVVEWGFSTTVPADLTNVVAIAAGCVSDFNMALKSNGTVSVWGNTDFGIANIPPDLTNVTAIAAGWKHGLALRTDRTVVAWGNNIYYNGFGGQTNVPIGLNGVKAVAAGWYHSLALRSNGTVVAWGANNLGQCNVPAGLTNVIAIAGAPNRSIALRADGTLVGWSSNYWAASPTVYTNYPLVPDANSNIVKVAMGLFHNLALKNDGTVIAWGRNEFGGASVPAGLSNVIAIAAGAYHSLALKADGTVKAWGFGGQEPPPGLSNVIAIAAGDYQNIAIVSDGSSPPPAVAPSITSQPTNLTIYAGGTAIFRVTATGSAPLSYQWWHSTSPLAGKTSSVLSLENPQAGSYFVVITNEAGSVTSSPAILTVLPTPVPPTITSQPTNLSVHVTSNATFRVTATGTTPLSYQWRFNGTNLIGRTSSVLTLVNVEFSNAGPYSVVVSNVGGSVTSSPASLTVVSLPGCAPISSGMVSWWKGESTAADSVGNNHGVMFNPKFIAGKVGQAFSIGGVYVTVSNSPSLRFTNAMSVEAWVNPAVFFISKATMVSKFDYVGRVPGGGTNSSFYFGVTNFGRLYFAVSSNGSGRTNVTTLISPQSLPLNQWSHVAAAYDGATLFLYVNGSLVAEMNYSAGIFGGTSPLGIGGLPYSQSFVETFSGLIDEVTLFNRALSQAELLSIYNAGANGKCFPLVPACTEPPSGLISWWPGDGNTADAMGTNNAFDFITGTYVTGKVDRAFNFTAGQTAPSGLQAPALGSLNFGSNAHFTIEAWIKTSATNANLTLFEKRTISGFSGVGYSLSLNNGRLALWLGTTPFTPNSPTNTATFTSPGPDLRDGVFHHVAVSLNRSATNGGNLFVDGQLVQTFNPVPFRGSLSNSSLFYFARPTSVVSNSFFAGQIDEAAIYGRALSVAEINAIFDSGAQGKCKVKPSILTPPLSQRVTVGSNATFTVVAAGSPKLRYQWLRNGSTIAQATNSILTFPVFDITVQNPAGDNYSVRVTNLFGSVTSSNALLTVNHRPTIDAHNISVIEDTPAPVSFFANDVDHDPLTLIILKNPAHGALSGTLSNLVYTPTSNYFGPDSFTFKLNDGNADSAPATVNVTVLPVNDLPVAYDQSVSLDEDTTVPILLVANDMDGDTLAFSIVTPPGNGVFNAGSYTPNTNYFGPDSFTFRVNDGQTNSNVATVSLTVRPINDPPMARFTISPLTEFPDFTNQIVIALASNAMVVLDGSSSSDADSDPLQLFWWEGTNHFASGMIITNNFPPAAHEITLVVSDGQATGTNSTRFEVLTPARSVGLILSLIENSDLAVKMTQPLLASLNAAAKAFGRGNTTAALNDLKAFQNKVSAQIGGSHPELASKLLLAAQKIIEVFNLPTIPLRGEARPSNERIYSGP